MARVSATNARDPNPSFRAMRDPPTCRGEFSSAARADATAGRAGDQSPLPPPIARLAVSHNYLAKSASLGEPDERRRPRDSESAGMTQKPTG